MSNPDDPAQLQAQQEYIRSLLRAQEPQPGQDKQAEDPMMKVLNSLLGGADGSDPADPGGLPFSPDDISKATGLPPFLTNMFLGQAKVPPTAAEEQTARICALVRVVLSLVVGIYVVYILSSSSKMYGSSPPAPPTLKNPFLVFITGEIFLHTTQMFLLDRAVPKGMWAWWQILKDTTRDGSIVIFMMGAASWLSIYR
jgi:GET complex subunit GET2